MPTNLAGGREAPLPRLRPLLRNWAVLLSSRGLLCCKKGHVFRPSVLRSNVVKCERSWAVFPRSLLLQICLNLPLRKSGYKIWLLPYRWPLWLVCLRSWCLPKRDYDGAFRDRYYSRNCNNHTQPMRKWHCWMGWDARYWRFDTVDCTFLLYGA